MLSSGLGGFFGLSLLFFGNLLNEELMSDLLLVDDGSESEHASNNTEGETEDDEVVDSGGFSLCDSEFKVGPPMETIEQIKEHEHGDDLYPVSSVVLIDVLLVSGVLGEVSTVLLRFSKVFLFHLIQKYTINI
jgi:hypothetical protein